ncbi:MAG: hypothetical protein WCO96_01185 [Actinomycetes bacterium]
MAYPDLTTRAAVRAHLQKPTGDTAQDAIIDSLISRSSAAIQRYCDREFVSAQPGTQGSPVARVFETEVLRDGFLDLAPYDAKAGTITQIRLDTDLDTPRVLTSSEWRPWPIPARDGVVTALRVAPTSLGGYHRFRNRQFEVTAQWGWPSVPYDVEYATIVTTTIWLRREVAAFSTTYNLDEDRVERPEALPSAVRAMLATYRRSTLG